ncbi:hypothetical protein CW362_21735 [Streptomyces populi]|uniref:Uncharacterized protein n=1 Tax=Streptomyces populi TaxID=2058924 RepID=A0A2I0SLV1_9ACTN|nr:hypothetical protein CW362_21735 [Streptomyces populi]
MTASSSFEYDGIGAPRIAVPGEMRQLVESCSRSAAMWRAEPTRGGSTLERAGRPGDLGRLPMPVHGVPETSPTR